MNVNEAPSSWSGALAQSAANVAKAARDLGTSQWASTLRAWCVRSLFHQGDPFAVAKYGVGEQRFVFSR